MIDAKTLLASNIVSTPIAGHLVDGEPIFGLYDMATGKAIGTVRPDWRNVIRATSVVHQLLDAHIKSLDELSQVLESIGRDDVSATIDTLAANMQLAQRVAIHGVEILTKGK